MLTGLSVSTEACMADVHARAATLMEILTPSQTVRCGLIFCVRKALVCVSSQLCSAPSL